MASGLSLVNICCDLDVAAVLVAGGAQVVLCRPDGASLGQAVSDLRGGAASGARVAALVGDLADPEVAAAALALARELFGDQPVFVATVSAARDLVALQPGSELPPGSERNGSGTV